MCQRRNLPNSKKSLTNFVTKVPNEPKNCEKCDPKRDKKIPQIDIFIRAGMHLSGFTLSGTWEHGNFFFSEDWDSKVIYLHLHLFIRRPHTAFHSFLAISHPSWIGYQTKGIDRVVSVFGISVFQKATFSVILFFVQDMEYGAAKLEARTALSIDLESKNCVDPRSKLLH